MAVWVKPNDGAVNENVNGVANENANGNVQDIVLVIVSFVETATVLTNVMPICFENALHRFAPHKCCYVSWAVRVVAIACVKYVEFLFYSDINYIRTRIQINDIKSNPQFSTKQKHNQENRDRCQIERNFKRHFFTDWNERKIDSYLCGWKKLFRRPNIFIGLFDCWLSTSAYLVILKKRRE